MSRRVRPLVVVLLLLILLLLFGIFRARSSASLNVGELPSTGSTLNLTYAVYREEESGLYGVRDSNGRVMIAPEWEILNRVSDNCYIAGRTIDRTLLYGMVDLDEKLIVPQVCRSITSLGYGVLAAELEKDGTYLFYNRSGKLLFPDSWEAYTLTGKTLSLFATGRNCTGTLASEEIILTTARITAPMLNEKLTMAFDSNALDQGKGYALQVEAVYASAAYLGAMILDDYSSAYPLTRPDSYSDVIHSGLMKDCFGALLTPTGFSVFRDSEQGCATRFTITYSRVITPSHGEIPAVTETCSRDLELELVRSDSGALVLRRVTYSEEYSDMDL